MTSSTQPPQSERDVRIAKAQALRAMGINPYAQKFDKTSMIGDHLAKYEKNITDGSVSPFRDINDIIADPVAHISTAGRLTLYRTHGKLSFGKLMDESGEIQVMWHRDACELVQQQIGSHDNKTLSFTPSRQSRLAEFEHTQDGAIHYTRALIKNEQGEYCALFDTRFGHYQLAGGKVDKGETHEQALTREVKEELGCDVVSVSFVGAKKILFGLGLFVSNVYEVEITGTPQVMEPKKFSHIGRGKKIHTDNDFGFGIDFGDVQYMTDHELCEGGMYEVAYYFTGKSFAHADLSCDFSGLIGAENDTIYHQYLDTQKNCYIRSNLGGLDNDDRYLWIYSDLGSEMKQGLEKVYTISPIQTLPVIFIDGIHTSIIKKDGSPFGQNLTPDNLEPNHDLRDYFDTLPYCKIIVTNADETLIKDVLKDKKFDDIFTLNNNPNKTDPSYYDQLFKKTFGDEPDKYIYFDHAQTNLDSAKKAGMEGILYTGVEELKKEIDKKLQMRCSPRLLGEGLGVRSIIDRSSTPLFDQYPLKKGMPMIEKTIVIGLIYDPKTNSYLCNKWIADNATTFVGGGLEEGENPLDAIVREIREETGYTDISLIKNLSPYRCNYRHEAKQANYITKNIVFAFELVSHHQEPIDPSELAKHTPTWIEEKKLESMLSNPHTPHLHIFYERMKSKNLLQQQENLYFDCFKDYHIKPSQEDVHHALQSRKQAKDYVDFFIYDDNNLVAGIIGYAFDNHQLRKDSFLPFEPCKQYFGQGCFYIESVFVYQKYRGKGYAQQLREKVEHQAQQLGYKKILLSVASTNTIKQRYEKIGYKAVMSFDDGGVLCHFMEKIISLSNQPPTTQPLSLPDGLTPYKLLEKYIDVGDFLGVRGELFYTHKGELTLFVSEWMLLSKAIRPLGDKFHGIGDDKENAYRQRYLDMIFNRETLERMKLRSKFLKAIRNFYDQYDFLEVETPVLGNSASGAAAAPFVTHHNDFDIDMYLRISPETNLKKATVGGLERVFEVAKDFRNEGSDPSHIQEFTMIEHYACYRNHEDNMRFTESMFDYIFQTIPQLSKIVPVADKNGVVHEVNFQTPRQRVDYVQQIQKDSGIDVSQYMPEDEEQLRADILAKGHTWIGIETQGTATMIDYLYKKVTRPKIIGPAFIVNYPATMQPLARKSDINPGIVEQRQLLVNGRELIKAYSELVDPIQQQANFDAQADAVAKGDEEATKGDDDFVLAMEYGMPCQSGRGMGVDRILAMLTSNGQPLNIRDVVLFPLVKPLVGSDIVGPEEKGGKKSDQTQMTVILLNQGANLEARQEMNTIAHLTAAFGARHGKSGLFSHNTIQTKDHHDIFLNIKNAIMIKTIPNNTTLQVLRAESLNEGLHIADFTREMITTTDDKKIVTITQEKSDQDIEHLGLLIHGPKKVVEEMTKGFGLYGK